MAKENDIDLALVEILAVIEKYKLTYAEYKSLKEVLDQSVDSRIIGSKKA